VVVCDRIRDPGNLGTIVRSARAAGCLAVITTEFSADLWGTAALRAGAGAQFHIPLLASVSWQVGVSLFLAREWVIDIGSVNRTRCVGTDSVGV